MQAPFLFISTHSVNAGTLDDLMVQNKEFIDFVEANEPRTGELQVFMNDKQTELSLVFAFSDAEAADTHMKVAREQIARGLEITRTVRLDVFGTPGPVLSQVLRANADQGVPVNIKSRALGGIARSTRAARPPAISQEPRATQTADRGR